MVISFIVSSISIFTMHNHAYLNSKHIIHSCTKSIVSALIGIAIDQGYIEGVHQPVLDLFAERTAANLVVSTAIRHPLAPLRVSPGSSAH